MLRSLIPLFSVLLSVAQSAVAQDEAKLLAAFAKAFHPAKKENPTIEARAKALADLQGLDSAKVAEALTEAWRATAKLAATVDAQRDAAQTEMAELLGAQAGKERRVLPQEKQQRFLELRDLLPKLRGDSEALHNLQQDLADRIAALRQQPSLLFLLQKVLPGKADPVPLRLAAGRALGGGATAVMAELAAAAARFKEPEELLPVIDAFGIAGTGAAAHAPVVIALLQHKEEAVRERAALALARLLVPAAIEPMIALLGKSSGQVRMRVASALEVLTGEKHGLNVGAWQGWWAAEGAAVLAGGRVLGKGVPSHRKTTDENYYFGIPQDQSNAILYVIDCSGSMQKQIEMPVGPTVVGGKPPVQTRLEACQKELVRALGMLRPEQKFGILWYNDLPHLWQPKMQNASKAVVDEAKAFVLALTPAASTNIHDALEQGFRLVGRGARDRYYGVELDTIFLLTDGSPTKATGEPDSTETILTAARLWNPLQRVTLHTIGIGPELNDAFLAELARQHGGEYKKF